MPLKKILLIEDDPILIEKVRLHSALLHCELLVESSVENGYLAIEKTLPDVILLNLLSDAVHLEFEFCKTLKKHPRFLHIPIFILANAIEETNALLGLEIGAEDYLPKSVSLPILFARIQKLLSKQKPSSSVFSFGEFVIDPQKHMLRKGGILIDVTLSQFGLLKTLALHKGKVLTRNQLLSHIQDKETDVVDRNIDVHIAALRKKLGPHFHWIETVRGIGYRLVETPSIRVKKAPPAT